MGLGHFFGNVGLTAPGKAKQSPCSCLESGVAPSNSCLISMESCSPRRSHTDLAQARYQAGCQELGVGRPIALASSRRQREGCWHAPGAELLFLVMFLVLVKDVAMIVGLNSRLHFNLSPKMYLVPIFHLFICPFFSFPSFRTRSPLQILALWLGPLPYLRAQSSSNGPIPFAPY